MQWKQSIFKEVDHCLTLSWYPYGFMDRGDEYENYSVERQWVYQADTNAGLELFRSLFNQYIEASEATV